MKIRRSSKIKFTILVILLLITNLFQGVLVLAEGNASANPNLALGKPVTYSGVEGGRIGGVWKYPQFVGEKAVDEDSVAAVKNNLPYASMVHVKDFYLRPSYLNPGEGLFKTISGNYLRGAIVGHGDIDMREVLRVVKNSGYDGYISLEFEGMEECKAGTKANLDNIRRLWEEI